MDPYRKNAIAVGILFLACTAATLLSYAFSGPYLKEQDTLASLAEHSGSVITGALMEFIWAASAMGIAVWLYPVLRKSDGALALWSVGFRMFEGIIVLIGTLCLLGLLSLSLGSASGAVPGDAALRVPGALMLGVRDWAQYVLTIIAFNLGAMLYYTIMYRAGLVPRWLSGWGLIGTLMSLAAALITAYRQSFGEMSSHELLNVPIALNELILAVWLILKGFNPTAPDAGTAGPE